MICLYALVPIILLWGSYLLLRKRGMKSGIVWKGYIFQPNSEHATTLYVYDPLHPQEKSNPTSKENENG